jgi:hypothetical protein
MLRLWTLRMEQVLVPSHGRVDERGRREKAGCGGSFEAFPEREDAVTSPEIQVKCLGKAVFFSGSRLYLNTAFGCLTEEFGPVVEDLVAHGPCDGRFNVTSVDDAALGWWANDLIPVF